MPQVIHRQDLSNALPDAEASYRFEGREFGDIAVSFFWTDAPPGTGPRLHQHPYPEIFVVQEGHVTFTVGGETLDATGGQIVIAPAGQPHKYVHAGTGHSRHLDIQPSGRMMSTPIGTGNEIVMPRVIHRNDLPHGEAAHRFEGREFGDIPMSFFWTDAPPESGPRLHTHPYTEVFVIWEGEIIFTVGDETVPAAAGQIVVVPPGVPHKSVNAGTGRARHIDIHTSGHMATEWLEE